MNVDANQGSPTQPSTTGQPPSKHRSYFKTHGKANPDRIEEISKEISRLRLYFDSPAGLGPGESRRRGGIEGGERKSVKQDPLDVAPVRTPTPLLPPSTAEEAVVVKDETSPSEETNDDEDPKDTASNIDGEEIEDLSMRGSVEPVSEPAAVEAVVPNGTEGEHGLPDNAEEDKPAELEPESSVVVAVDVESTEAEPETQLEEPAEPPSAVDQDPTALTTPIVDPPSISDGADGPFEPSVSQPTPTPTPAEPLLASPLKPTREPSLPLSDTLPTTEPAKPSPALYAGPEPSPDRVSILYERCTRRLCMDASVIERVRISRAEGKVEFTIRWRKPEREADEVARVKVEEPVGEEIPTVPGAGEGMIEAPGGDESAEKGLLDDGSTLTDPALVKPETDELGDTSLVNNEQPDKPVDAPLPGGEVEPTQPVVVALPPSTGETAHEPKDERVWDICRGILMELLEEETDRFQPVVLDTLEDMWDEVEDPCAGWTPVSLLVSFKWGENVRLNFCVPLPLESLFIN